MAFCVRCGQATEATQSSILLVPSFILQVHASSSVSESPFLAMPTMLGLPYFSHSDRSERRLVTSAYVWLVLVVTLRDRESC